MGKFVDETVKDPRKNAATRSAPRTHGPAGVKHGLLGLVIGDPAAGKLIGAEIAAAAGATALAKGEKVVFPCDNFSLGVDPTF